MDKSKPRKDIEEKNYYSDVDDDVLDECEKILNDIFNHRKYK